MLTEQTRSLPPTRRRQQLMEFFARRDAATISRTSADEPQSVHIERAPVDSNDTHDEEYLTSLQEEYGAIEEAYREADISVQAEELRGSLARSRNSTSNNFAPAHRYYEDLQREQLFDITPARGRAHRFGSPGSVIEGNRERVASPDTEQAILREIRNQEDSENRSRLYVDGSSETPAIAPRMTISQTDGLGDRSRSPSRDDDHHYGNRSDTEENWNDLTDTIPSTDENVPSIGSSFASDSASSILSRRRPRSSLTNTTSSRSRAESEEAMQTPDHLLHCPEAFDPQSVGLGRQQRRTSSLAPVRYSSTPAPRSRYPRSAASAQISSELTDRLSSNRSQGLERLDDLMDMIHSGMEVPAERWAAVGITPHLALRGGAGRYRRRNERL